MVPEYLGWHNGGNLIRYIENITGTNSLGDPASNLVCSHLLWFNAPCETNPNLLSMGEELLEKLDWWTDTFYFMCTIITLAFRVESPLDKWRKL